MKTTSIMTLLFSATAIIFAWLYTNDTSFINLSEYQTDKVQTSNIASDTKAIDLINTKSTESVNPNMTKSEMETTVASFATDNTDNLIDYLQEIKTLFPEMATEIDLYQEKVIKQNELLSEFRQWIDESNKQAKEEGFISSDKDLEIKRRKNELLAAAEELGREAMEINGLIRVHVANYQHDINNSRQQ